MEGSLTRIRSGRNYFISNATTFVSPLFLLLYNSWTTLNILWSTNSASMFPLLNRCFSILSATPSRKISLPKLASRSATIPRSVLISASQKERESKWGEGSSSISIYINWKSNLTFRNFVVWRIKFLLSEEIPSPRLVSENLPEK